MKIMIVVKSKQIETLGPLYLAGVIRDAGHESRIVTIEEALEIAEVWKPALVGYSIMTGDVEKFKALNKEIVKAIPQVTTIVGGPHPTFYPQDFTAEGNDIHLIVKGEGEQMIANILQYNIEYDGIDSFPWPERKDFPNMKIRDFIASRGCIGKCRYCYSDQWARMFPEIPRVRFRDAKDVVNEIKSVKPEFTYFQDSCFGVPVKWLREFSKLYQEEVNVPFCCHMRPNQVTEEKVRLLAKCNCHSLKMAMESASSRLRVLINRGKMELSDIRKSIELLHKKGIKVELQNMIGLPTGDLDDDLFTLETTIKFKPDYAWVSIFQPYPGTELGFWCRENGWYSGDYSEITDSFFEKSVLNFDDQYKEQLKVLQKIFALCVEAEYMPEESELTIENFPNLTHRIMRKLGDRRLYRGAY